MKDFTYIGSELDLFSEAINWKTYYTKKIRRYIGDQVLEVGAGIGTTTKVLCNGNQKLWLCLEPDANLINNIQSLKEQNILPLCCEIQVGNLETLSSDQIYDTIIYIDVLEHIENDQNELEIASNHLANNGKIIVLSPAYQWLYTPFDRSIGHFRRYDKKSLLSLTPKDLKCVKVFYLDSVGLLASLSNLLILKSPLPNRSQIQFWDRVMVPLSRFFDRLINYSAGRSIVAIWEKTRGD